MAYPPQQECTVPFEARYSFPKFMRFLVQYQRKISEPKMLVTDHNYSFIDCTYIVKSCVGL